MNLDVPPHQTVLTRLADDPGAEHQAARTFCLETIKEFYGFDYRPDWHGDLDSLVLPAAKNHFARQHRGAFWTLRAPDGAMVATAGIRHLGWKPNIPPLFPGRYPNPEAVASLWRVYVRRDRRGQGLGRWLTALSHAEAKRLGYDTMYLHATADAAATIAFWTAMGYCNLGTIDGSMHFDATLGTGLHGARQHQH